MSTRSLDSHIETTPGICGGKPRIAGHRITVQQIVMWHDRLGRSAEEIATEYDLEIADVYAALAYYFDNREAIDAGISDSADWVEQLRKQTPSLVERKIASDNGDG